MMQAVVASGGSKSPLIFIVVGLKVNSELCGEMLDEKLLTFDDYYIFTEDDALINISNVTQN